MILLLILSALNFIVSVSLLVLLARLINALCQKQECAWTIEFGKGGLIVGKESEGEE